MKVDGNDVSDVQSSNIPFAFVMLAPSNVEGNDASDEQSANI